MARLIPLVLLGGVHVLFVLELLLALALFAIGVEVIGTDKAAVGE